MHASIVLGHDITDYASLYLEIADTYFDKDLYMDARPIYEALGTDASVCGHVPERALVIVFIRRRAACIFSSKPQPVVGLLVTIKKLLMCMSTVCVSITPRSYV
jgi:hypothetical protein